MSGPVVVQVGSIVADGCGGIALRATLEAHIQHVVECHAGGFAQSGALGALVIDLRTGAQVNVHLGGTCGAATRAAARFLGLLRGRGGRAASGASGGTGYA